MTVDEATVTEVFDVLKRALDEERSRGQALEAKAATLAGFTGAILALSVAGFALVEDGVVGAKTMAAVTAAAWALGARRETIA
jgi:hypothetical protein